VCFDTFLPNDDACQDARKVQTSVDRTIMISFHEGRDEATLVAALALVPGFLATDFFVAADLGLEADGLVDLADLADTGAGVGAGEAEAEVFEDMLRAMMLLVRKAGNKFSRPFLVAF